VLFSQHPIWGAIPTLRRGFEVQQLVPEAERGRLPTAQELFDDRPTFALVHLLLPHDPYEPPPPWRGAVTGDTSGQAGRFAVDSGALHDYRLRRGRRAPVPDPEQRAYARARYDETMLWTDALVGELVARIDAAGRAQPPLVVLVSDHGEAFYEHGWFLHTRTLYEEMTAVPLLFRWPPATGGAVPVLQAGPVSTIDLMPTLVDLLALPYDGPGMQGRSLGPWFFGPAPPGEDGPGPTYSVTARVETGSAPPLLAWRDGRHKVIYDTLWGIVELYDLEVDPGEHDDLSQRRPLLTQQVLQGLLSQHRANLAILGAWRDAGQTTELDAEAIARLRALGYLR
jgi:arylsulfatase A-like enzyme